MLTKVAAKEQRGNIIFRQELNSITPECGPICSLICNFLLLVIFLSLGIPIVVYQNKAYEQKIEYTNW